MNADLFRRVKAVFESDEALTDEQRVVTEKYYKMFVRAGANLDGEKRDRFKAVMQRLAELGTTFSQNVLAEERGWDLTLEEADLDGLPDFLISALKGSAEARDKTGYLLTLTPSLIGPFLQFSTRRDLREAVTAAWKARGANGGDHDNRDVIKETLALRAERAQILGYADFASFKLEEEMAKTPGAVRELLEAVWEPAKTRAEQDAVILAQMMKDDGINDAFRPSDWHYYAEKRKQAEHDLDEAELKPYLQLDNMIAASFDCAGRLFGLSFEEITPDLYHDDARAWDVTKDGRHIGVSLLSDVHYPMISGTSVARDFVELPSQLYEHWLSVPEVLSKHALHADSGAAMPLEMVKKVLAAENADQGYATVTYVASAIVDIDFHTGTAPADPMAAQAAPRSLRNGFIRRAGLVIRQNFTWLFAARCHPWQRFSKGADWLLEAG